MTPKLRQAAISLAILGVLCAIAIRPAGRLRLISKVTGDQQSLHQLRNVPRTLELPDKNASPGREWRVGYAQFSIPGPDRPAIQVSDSGLAVQIKWTSGSMALLPPAKLQPLDSKSQILCAQLAQTFGSESSFPIGRPQRTILDLMVATERTIPQPTWDALLMGKEDFNSYYFALVTKLNVLKSQTTHLFQNDQTRGLVRVWADDNQGMSAHASIESLIHDWSVGFFLRDAGTTREDVLAVLAAILADFRFADRAFPDKAELTRWISAAVADQQPTQPEAGR